MYVLRQRRIRLAREYAVRYEPVSEALFQRQLPRGDKWPGVSKLVSAPIYASLEDV
jgi:hypothetical protein